MTPSSTLHLPLTSAWLSQLWLIRKENSFRSTDVLVLPWRGVCRAESLDFGTIKSTHLKGFSASSFILSNTQLVHSGDICAPCYFCKWSIVWNINIPVSHTSPNTRVSLMSYSLKYSFDHLESSVLAVFPPSLPCTPNSPLQCISTKSTKSFGPEYTLVSKIKNISTLLAPCPA